MSPNTPHQHRRRPWSGCAPAVLFALVCAGLVWSRPQEPAQPAQQPYQPALQVSDPAGVIRAFDSQGRVVTLTLKPQRGVR